MKPACGYIRVSTLGQFDGDGFERQRQAIQAFTAANGFAIVETFEERGVSGKTDGDARPAFQQMISALLASECRTVVVESLDRLAREYRVQEHLLIYLASKGIGLIAANTGECVTDAIAADPMRKALVQIQGIFAELDRNLLVRKLRMARERKKAATGRCEGQKPYGDLPGESAAVAKMRQLREQGWTLESIAADLNAAGIASRHGAKWHAKTVSRILEYSARTAQVVSQ